MNDKEYTVYIHTNKQNNKSYVGITCQKPEYRWGSNGNNYDECPYFYRAIQKYGWDCFEHKILYQGQTHDQACEIEIRLIASMKQNDPQFGYNISKGGDGIDSDTIKKIWSDENFRAFASEKMKETWRDPKKRIRRSNYAKERWQDPSQREQIRKGIINACGRSVVCVESNIVYGTMQEAAIAHNVDKSNIHRAIKTGYKCGGCHWKYADNVS